MLFHIVKTRNFPPCIRYFFFSRGLNAGIFRFPRLCFVRFVLFSLITRDDDDDDDDVDDEHDDVAKTKQNQNETKQKDVFL